MTLVYNNVDFTDLQTKFRKNGLTSVIPPRAGRKWVLLAGTPQ